MSEDKGKFILELLDLLVEHDCVDSIFWRKDKGQIVADVNCNDWFCWACADGEDITADSLPELKKAIEDVVALDRPSYYGTLLYCCRRRKMRPQGACYPKGIDGKNVVLWPLFDACGPEREIGIGNPYKPGEYKTQLERNAEKYKAEQAESLKQKEEES